MRLLETWVETPLAGAVGWTLLHSLWEGAIIAAALAAVLMAVRSPRARYAAACVAMLVMLVAFGLTLVRVMPEGAHGVRTARTASLFGMECSHRHRMLLALRILALPPSCPGSRRSGSQASGFSTWGTWPAGSRYAACAAAACVARPSTGSRTRPLERPVASVAAGPCCWNPAWRMRPWSLAISVRSF